MAIVKAVAEILFVCGSFSATTFINVAEAIFPFVNGRCHLERSLPFRSVVYCRFHKEDKVLIGEIQLMLTLIPN